MVGGTASVERVEKVVRHATSLSMRHFATFYIRGGVGSSSDSEKAILVC